MELTFWRYPQEWAMTWLYCSGGRLTEGSQNFALHEICRDSSRMFQVKDFIDTIFFRSHAFEPECR
jgi:hypothetical protein